jgi:hypothetical protein
MKNISALIIVIMALAFVGCTETEFEKVAIPTNSVTGEFVVELNLPDLDITDHQHILIYNTAGSKDSIWVEDHDFFESMVRVKYDGNNKFSVTNGIDILHGASVNIKGEVFPEKDSIHVEWTYLQVDIGLGDDDYLVTANGILYNGITN